MGKPVPVFDGHNDFLWRVRQTPERREDLWLKSTGEGHLDLPRMRAGGFAGGFFAIWIPSPGPDNISELERQMNNPPFVMPLPDLIPYDEALRIAVEEMGLLLWMERTGELTICRSVADIQAAMAAGRIAAILHMEGAEAIGADLDALHVWHAAGLRSLGPVWSRPTIFGHGVPFAYPSSPDTGDGLTPAGKDLIRECNALRVLVDVSHLNEKGFNDVAAISDAPIVATHSNAHAVTQASRNLTDRQLAMIRESDGMVGLNYAVGFLRSDGLGSTFSGWDPVLRHLDHLIEHLGEDRVGLGSDFDGAVMPADLGDVAGLPRLLDGLRAHGYGEELVEKIAWRNWLAVLGRVWG